MRPPAGGRQYIYWYPSNRPYLGNVAKLIRLESSTLESILYSRRISLERDNHPPTKHGPKHGSVEVKISLQNVTTNRTQSREGVAEARQGVAEANLGSIAFSEIIY
jgi:hypothetical protein